MKKLIMGAVWTVSIWPLFHVLCEPISDLMNIEVLRNDWVASSDSFLCALASVLMVAVWTHDGTATASPETTNRVFCPPKFSSVSYYAVRRIMQGTIFSFHGRSVNEFQNLESGEELRLFITFLRQGIGRIEVNPIADLDRKILEDRASFLNLMSVR